MKQLVQYASGGEVCLIDIPRPEPKPKQVLVRTLASAVSTGTERGNLDFARASILEKARRRPDLVEKVVTKALQEGPMNAYRQAKARLDEPFPLGYSSAGVVEELGEGCALFRPGQLVACSGARFATHSEFVTVPETMCAPIPEGVSLEDAAFSALAAVVIHAMRRGGVEVGSRVGIIGLGLLGLIGVQVAKACGAVVVGADVSQERCDLASTLGGDFCVVPTDSSAELVRSFCGPTEGVDVALVTATSKTNEPFVWAAEIARERGHLVVVGNFPPDLPRRYGYDKELTIEFSRAWGPGTYDPEFYLRGHSEGYPLSLVRWTAPQNMRTYLELVASGKVSAQRLITHRFPIDRAVDAYHALEDPAQSPLAVLITYPTLSERDSRESEIPSQASSNSAITEEVASRPKRPEQRRPFPFWLELIRRRQKICKSAEVSDVSTVRLGIIGAGNHVSSSLMPAISTVERVQVEAVCAPSGLRAAELAKKYAIPAVYSTPEDLLSDEDIDGVVIATRHDTHAQLAVTALNAGKHVLVEKPLSLTIDGIEAVEKAATLAGRVVYVGFNRRFSPLTKLAVDHVRAKGSGPYSVSIRANPGPLERGHWVLDPNEGGGRLLSEGCHFFDLACALVGEAPLAVTASITEPEGEPWMQGFGALVEFTDGSVASIVYAGAGPASFGREHFEIVGSSRAASVHDFRVVRRSGRYRTRSNRTVTAHKGFVEMIASFRDACRGGATGLRLMQEMLRSSRLSVSAQHSARTGEKVRAL